MPDVVVRPIVKAPVFSFGVDAAEASRQAARAQAAADQAEIYANEVRALEGGAPVADTVISASAQVAALTVSITDGRVSRLGAAEPIAFSGSVTLDAPSIETVTDEPHTLTYVNGVAAWPFLTAKLPDGNLTDLVVKDAATEDVLTLGTDYVADLRFGALGLAEAGSPRDVLVSYTTSRERYDLICVDPEYLASPMTLYVIKGEEAVRDAGERLPSAGQLAEGHTVLALRLPLYYARVTARSVELIKVWNLSDGVAREFDAQFRADQRRNRDAIRPLLDLIEAGHDTVWSAQGDSITALQSDVPSSTAPNGQYRDRAAASGTTNTYLREGIIDPALIDAIPQNYDNGDAAGAAHTRFGRTWGLIEAVAARFDGAVTYLSYSIAGTNSDDSPSGMTNPARLAAWADDGADAGIIATGMNDMDMSPTQLFERVRKMIDAKYAAGAKGVIVWGCSRPQAIAAGDAKWLEVNRVLRRAAETPGWGGRTAAFIDLSMIYYGHGAGTVGVAPADLCLANGFNHPGIRQHAIEGEFAQKVIFGRAELVATLPSTWDLAAKGPNIALSDGRTTGVNSNAAGSWEAVRATVSRTAGRWYYEALLDDVAGGLMVGIANASRNLSSFTGSDTNSISYSSGGAIFYGGNNVHTGAVQSNGDFVGVALDFAASKVWFSLNGAWQNGDPVAGTGGEGLPPGALFPEISLYRTDSRITANFGAASFEYGAPAGFTAWDG